MNLYIKFIWGFIKKPGLSVTYSWQIGFWERDIEASKMQGRARGRKGERKTYHITILYIQISCMYLIDYLYHILPFCLARWSLSRSVEAFVFKKCPAFSLLMWHVEWRIVPSGVSIGRRMLAFFFAQEIHYIMFCEKTESDRKSLWRKIRARHAQEKWCRGRFPLSSQVLQKDFLQKKTPHKSGFDSSTSSNDSEEPSHKIHRISVAVYKENLILIATCKSP